MLVARVEQDGDGGDGVVVVEIGIVHSTIFGVEVEGGVYYRDRQLFDGGGWLLRWRGCDCCGDDMLLLLLVVVRGVWADSVAPESTRGGAAEERRRHQR